MTALAGACLCGASRFEAVPVSGEAGVCHCSKCRKFSGGMFIVADCSNGLTFAEDAPLGVFRSSEWGERVFCKECGSSLAWRSVDGAMAFVTIQAFEDPARFAVTHEVFIDCKPANYALVGPTTTMTEAEFMAQYASNPEGGA